MRHVATISLAGAVLALAVFWVAVPGPAGAVEPDEILADPALEGRAREISKDIRCLVCQNQSIDDSDAGLARDLRLLIRERLTEGDDNQQVRDFLVARYGNYVLLDPPMNTGTILLWASPAILVLLGGLAVFVWFRGQARRGAAAAAAGAPAGLTADEERRVARLLDGAPGRDRARDKEPGA